MQTGVKPVDDVQRVASFLARSSPFSELSRAERHDVAATVEKREIARGNTLLVEGGPPGDFLFIVVEGILEVSVRRRVIDVVTSGGVVGGPTIVTGLAPEMTVRARDATILYAIPKEVAVDVLTRPQGVAFLARSMRERLVWTANMLQPGSERTSVPVSSLIRRPPVICEPDTTVRKAAELMSAEVVSAILVRTRDGLGIVSNADLRDRVIAAGLSPDSPVSAIMTTPVLTIRGDALASQANVEMLHAGVNHLVVVDEREKLIGVVSAASLMGPDALSPLALRWSIGAAHDLEELVEAAGLLRQVFASLVESRLDATAISRVITLQSDAMTQRLLELGIERRGPPPTPFAWLALGSGGRGELTLASDQDNALAYADSDEPDVDKYFAALAEDVNLGLARCGFPPDPSGVLASDRHWRMPLSKWVRVFRDCFEVWDFKHTLRASVSFDFRKVAGSLDIVTPLVDVLLEARQHPSLLNRLARTVTDIRSPLGFRQRLTGPIDVKKSALLPIENIARYYGLANRVTFAATLDRLSAVQELGGFGAAAVAPLPDAFRAAWNLRLRHHANAIRRGRPPDDAIDSAKLQPLTYAELQETLRVTAAAQKRVPEIVTSEDLRLMA